ncbi:MULTISPECIES: polysaccharide deacetylase family protein [unclassified Bradyrhizobium]|uniref:polysaccharide deacetylase family protein n=1 Tax=unclassified Bradyrhizobium TaxID=2631580 RepID=UPI0028E1F844|nr:MULTISPECIES: polysaccharide deacetylase family protein [unclassified Bradyrhizobium]
MSDNRSVCLGKRRWSAVLVCALLGTSAAAAAECPGHPDALGTSRVLVVDPLAHPRIGAMQYRETLPLHDHEVVLTFDDGPLPKYSNQVLQVLADQCVKATFFTIGRQAKASPEGVRKLAAAGHTIGTHSQNHPLSFNKMTVEQSKPEVDQGIASVSAALTDPSALTPFFRVPGLSRGEGVETYAASLGLQVWSADFVADDWRNISANRVYELAMKRLEARGKGILLLHDIHARTVAALPKILNELKARGYRIVQVVPATPDRPATPTEPQEWLVHPHAGEVPVAQWPALPSFNFAGSVTHSRATAADLDLLSAGPSDDSSLRREASWPQADNPSSPGKLATVLPVPAANLFAIPAPMPVAPPRRHLASMALVPPNPAAKSAAKTPAKTSAKSAAKASTKSAGKPASRAVRLASLRKR